MDIYKLDGSSREGNVVPGIFKITNLKQGVKDSNRVNVFVDGSFSFSLDIAQVVDYKVKVGQELSEEEFINLKKASEFGKLYQSSLKWVFVRQRSERETRDYLYRKICEHGLDKKYIDTIIGRLKERGYLDDYKFARWWVENRFVNKGVSKKRLEMELLKKGISQEAIDEVMNESKRDEVDEIKKMIAKKRAKYDDEKLAAYLVRQGFSYDLVKDLVKKTGVD